MKQIYSVISLPRTGTTSISKMAKLVGMEVAHAPLYSVDNHLKFSNLNFFSDTPMYSPRTVEKLSANSSIEVKFIYIEKDFNALFNSWKKVNLYRDYLRIKNADESQLNVGQVYDGQIHREVFKEKTLDEDNYKLLFSNHKREVLNLIKEYKKEVLIYDFNMGWEPFCKFLNKPIPNQSIPHLNRNTMFDPI